MRARLAFQQPRLVSGCSVSTEWTTGHVGNSGAVSDRRHLHPEQDTGLPPLATWIAETPNPSPGWLELCTGRLLPLKA